MRRTPDPLPDPDDAPNTGFWLRWRVISLALAVLLGVPAAYQLSNWYEKSQDAQAKQAARDKTKAELDTLQADQKAAQDAARAELTRTTAAEQALTQASQEALQNARKVLEDKDFSVRLTGPAHIQPGAPNSWTVETLNRHGAPVTPKKLELVVKDSAGKELHAEPHERPTGAVTTLNLSLDFWAKVKPGTELFLHVAALTDDDRKGDPERAHPARPAGVRHPPGDRQAALQAGRDGPLPLAHPRPRQPPAAGARPAT